MTWSKSPKDQIEVVRARGSQIENEEKGLSCGLGFGYCTKVLTFLWSQMVRSNLWMISALTIFMVAPCDAQVLILVQGVSNSASYGDLQAPGAGIAPGSIFVTFGIGLGPDALQVAPGYPLSTNLAGTTVRIGNTSAHVIYTSGTQVAAIAPSTLAPGLYPLTVTYNGRTSPAVAFPVTQTDFGIFTRNSAGYGQAAGQTVIAGSGDVVTLGLASSVRPGEPVVLYGTGLGAIPDAPDDQAPGAHQTTVPVQVMVAGKAITPDYAGRSSNYPGLDQINFTVPPDVAADCYVPVGVRANGRLSNGVSLPIVRTGRNCDHPYGLSETAMQLVDSGGTISLALGIMEVQSTETGTSQGAGIGFAEMDGDVLESFAATLFEPEEAPPEAGKCVVVGATDPNRTVTNSPSVGNGRYYDAGTSVRLAGPNFATDLPRTQGSSYGRNLTQNPLGPGVWTYSGTGGTDVAAFQMSVELPSSLTWTNRQSVIDSKQPLRIDWSGGGSELISIVVAATLQVSSGILFGSVECAANAADGTFTIPAAMLSSLPSGGTGGIGLTRVVTKKGFNVPLVRGGVVDGSQFQITYQSAGQVRIQ